MPSIRNAMSESSSRRQVPSNNGGCRDLGIKLGLVPPFLLSTLAHRLSELPLATLIFDSGEQGPSTTTAWAQVGMQRDGRTSFRGSIHESGAIGHQYISAVAFLDIKDAEGRTLVFAHPGSVAGTWVVGKSTQDWQDDGISQLVEAQWDQIKNSRIEWKLHVSTDPSDVLGLAAEGLFVGVVVVAAILVGGSNKCTWDTYTNEDGQLTARMTCE